MLRSDLNFSQQAALTNARFATNENTVPAAILDSVQDGSEFIYLLTTPDEYGCQHCFRH
jgi:hypothetical protein